MRHHQTGGEYGDGATDRLRNLTQRQNRQRDSRERPAICSINLMHAGLRFESAMLHHQGLTALAFPIPPGADRRKRRSVLGAKIKGNQHERFYPGQ